MLHISYRPRASLDLELNALYVAEVLGAPTAARTIYSAIRTSIELLAATPDTGRSFNDRRLDGVQYRSFVSGDYRIFYSYDAHTLTIWRVVHTRQDIDDYDLLEWDRVEANTSMIESKEDEDR